MLTENTPHLILGSTSRYRRELLERLRLPFRCVSPQVDETPLAGETPASLAQRLALAKEDVLILHPGPMNKGLEISPKIAYGSNSAIQEQVQNGVAIRMALLTLALTGGKNSETIA